MQHRAPRPLIDFWRRLPGTAAHRLGQVADADRTRVLAPLIALTLAIGGCAGVVSLTGESSTPGAESSTPTATPGAEGSLPTEPRDESDVPATDPGDDPSAAPSSQPDPEPTSDAGPSVPPTPGEGVRSRGSGPARPSPSPSAPSASPAADDNPPSTALSVDYPEPDAAEFLFSANEDASFACSLDGAAYVSCDSAQLYSDLTPGWHTFAVRATDSAGNTDPSPAETRWLAKSAHAGGA